MKRVWMHTLVLVTIIVSMYAMPVAEAAEEQGVVHTVFLWLKEPGNTTHRNQLIMATDRLRHIPGVMDIRFGEVIKSTRTIVDDSFDVGIYFYFNDIAAMNDYLVHPVHKRTVAEDIQPLVKESRAYDFYDTAVTGR